VAFGLLGALLLVALVEVGNDGGGSRRTSMAEQGMYHEHGAAAIRGTVATQEAEASEIIPASNLEYDEHMGLPWETGLERRGVTDPRAVADSIIDYADEGGDDVTGATSSKLRKYETAELDHTLERPDEIVGSVPTYRAESDYITSGVVGNYEKSLENGPVAAMGINGKAPARAVANTIIDEAVKATKDCTGVVDPNGMHGIGRGSPPCEYAAVSLNANCSAHSHLRVDFTLPHDERSKCRCDPGYSGPNDGECTICPDNFYCIGADIPPVECPANSVSLPGSHQCFCSPGFLGQPGPENPPTGCQVCPHGRVCHGGFDFELCPRRMTSPLGSSELSQCECKPGWFQPGEAQTCEICPQGFYCPLGPEKIACPAGAETQMPGAGKAEDCICAPGQYGDGHSCTECPANNYCLGGDHVEPCPAMTHSSVGSRKATDCIESPLPDAIVFDHSGTPSGSGAESSHGHGDGDHHGIVEGTAFDITTGEGVPHAEIHLDYAGQIMFSSESDDGGMFEIHAPPAAYEATATAEGYCSASESADVHEDHHEPVTRPLALSPILPAGQVRFHLTSDGGADSFALTIYGPGGCVIDGEGNKHVLAS